MAVIWSTTNIFFIHISAPTDRYLFAQALLLVNNYLVNVIVISNYNDNIIPTTMTHFSEGFDRRRDSHHHVIAIMPFGNHAPPIGQPPTCFKSGSHFNRRTTVSFQL
jgi:hypothetical protein